MGLSEFRELAVMHRSGRRVAAMLLFGTALAAPARAQEAPATCPDIHDRVAPAPPADADLPAVAPVICDEEFQTAIPPLQATVDPELERPLESIEQFEKSMLAGEGRASSGEASGRGITTAGTAPNAARDPELDKPLPPLDQFDVREVDLAEPAPTIEAAELRYAVSVEGLERADEATDVAMREQFDQLSALGEGDGKAANEAMLDARLEEDSKLLERILHAEGWYDAKIETRIQRGSAEDGQPVTAILSVAPGRRYALGTITIDSATPVPGDLITHNLPLAVGDPIVAERIQGAEANVAVELPRHGYPFATVGQRDVLLDQDTHLGDYTLPIDLGPRSRFGGFTTEGDLAFGVEHVRELARFKRGELYDSDDVDDLRQALIATGLFRTVSVEPVRTGVDAGEGTQFVTMHVTQQAGPPRTLAASAGYGTGEGFRASASWTHRNLFPPEGALIASATAGTRELGANLTFRRSNAGKRDRTFQAGLEARRADYDAFKALTGRLFANLSYDSTPIWRKTFTWALGAEVLGTVENAYDFDLGKRAKRKYAIAGISGQFGIDKSDDLLDPTRGFKAQVFLNPEGALSKGFQPYLRSIVSGSAYYPVGDSLVLAGRALVGSIVNVPVDELAPSRRLYAGGGGSVRGFAFQQLGPKAPDGRPLGGLSKIEGAAEVRYRFGDYGLAAFVDAGQVYDRSMPRFRNLRAGVGIGARYYTNFGPLRVDVATPLGRKPGESRFNVYMSIGQAF